MTNKTTYTYAKQNRNNNSKFTDILVNDISKANQEKKTCPIVDELNIILMRGNEKEIKELKEVVRESIQPTLRKKTVQTRLLGKDIAKVKKVTITLNDQKLYELNIENKDTTTSDKTFWEALSELQEQHGVTGEEIIDHFMRIEDKKVA